jgi:CHASE3 domain sensor protein
VFVVVTLLIVATLVVMGGCFAAVLGHFEPTVSSLIVGRNAVDTVQTGMLDEETGLRGYLNSGDQLYLSAYYAGQAAILAGDSGSVDLATRPDLVRGILAMRVAQQRWLSEWATPALAIERAVTSPTAQRSFLLSGKTLFDTYSVAARCSCSRSSLPAVSTAHCAPRSSRPSTTCSPRCAGLARATSPHNRRVLDPRSCARLPPNSAI